MFIYISFFVASSITIVQCQNISVYFPTYPANTDIGPCTCDLTANLCDVSCCCDPSCSASDKEAFACSSRDNQYTNSTPVISTVQPTCFQNTSIFTSNTPYIILKMGELVCIDYQRYSGSQYYQQPSIQTLDPGAFVRAINAEDSVTPPRGLPSGLTNYQVGTPIITFDSTRSVPALYSLPIQLFDNQLCSGSQLITYMNDFTSTCNRVVDSTSCSATGTLSPSTYFGGSLCFIRSPANPSDSSAQICYNSNATTASLSGICTNALQSLTITIFYTNPTGIISVTVTNTTGSPSNGSLFQQTFTVRFVKSGTSPSSTSSTHNPGYQQGAYIVAGIQNGSIINTLPSTQFAILKPLSTGFCDMNADSIPIRFGENVQSTCKYNLTSPTTCTDLSAYLIPIRSVYPYVAAYSNSNPSNITSDWLPVISCTSQMGDLSTPECQPGIEINATSNPLCYLRLDIQIAYTKIGFITNPQFVLSAVIFHYQGLPVSSTAPLSSPLLVTKSVTFQDISDPPVVEEGQIPTPDTRLPANFFYPFSGSRATKSMTLSAFSYVLISILFILM